MKIGFIKKKFNPYGGAEKYLATVIGRLRDEGHEIHLFCTEWRETEGVRLHRIENLSFMSAASVASFDRNVTRAVREAGMDCVFSFERTACGHIYRAGDGCHRQWLEIRRGVEGALKGLSFRINPLHIVLLGLEKKIFDRTGVIIANSTMVKDQITRHYGTPEDRIRVIYNGVDVARFGAEDREGKRRLTRNSLGIDGDRKVLLFVGSGFERKGLGVLVEAMPKVYGEAVLLVAGKGDERSYSGLARRLGVSGRLRMLGPRDDVDGLYAAADVFVLPTRYDPFSNATIEAMASGLPAITTRNNGAAELIADGREGFVIEDMLSSSELASRTNQALEDHARMGEAARRRALEFPIEGAVSSYLEAIRQCLP